jgi:hypothetical protein
MLRNLLSFGLMVACLGSVASAANASLVNVTGTWSYLINGQGITNQVFSGSATFTYDDSSITGTGTELIDNIALTTFSQSPSTIGVTNFDVTNSLGAVSFDDGVLAQTYVGGAISGPRNSPASVDDFRLIEYSGPLAAFSPEGLITVATFTGHAFATDESATFTHTAVPEPTGITLLGVGAAGMLRRAWRRRRRNQTLSSC